MVLSLSTTDYIRLLECISDSVWNSLSDISKPEPQLVANLVWNIPHQLGTMQLSSGTTITSSGVFVHAQPFVQCTSFPESRPKAVELGDLLLLRTSIVNNVVQDRHAMLLQAKKVRSNNIKPDNKNQYHLYVNWPQFEYVRSGDLNRNIRHVTGPDLVNGAKYLLIVEAPTIRAAPTNCIPFLEYECYPCLHRLNDRPCVKTAQALNPALSHFQCFINDLLNFMIGNSGKCYLSPPPPASNDWDQVIQDLVQNTVHKHTVFMKSASHQASDSRGSYMNFYTGTTVPMSSLEGININNLVNDNIVDGPPRVPGHWRKNEEGDGMISIIEFVVKLKSTIRDD